MLYECSECSTIQERGLSSSLAADGLLSWLIPLALGTIISLLRMMIISHSNLTIVLITLILGSACVVLWRSEPKWIRYLRCISCSRRYTLMRCQPRSAVEYVLPLADMDTPQVSPPQRYPLNVEGDFYVKDGCCTACEIPFTEAPDLFERDGYHCYVRRQPETGLELVGMLEAIRYADLRCIRYAGSNPRIQLTLIQEDCDDICDNVPPDIAAIARANRDGQ